MEVTAESPGRFGGCTSSPEFEFCKIVGNPNSSADELFAGGVLLPLHRLSVHSNSNNTAINVVSDSSNYTHNCLWQQLKEEDKQEEKEEGEEEEEEDDKDIASIASYVAPVSASRRWRDIFKVGDMKNAEINEKEKKTNKGRKNSGASGAAELNINIWPFRRSRSAGNGGAARPKAAVFSRSISSAPCSRCNSSSASRRCVTSPGRAGIRVSRSSPVWKLKKNKTAASSGGDGLRAINMHGNNCVEYRSQMRCRVDDQEGTAGVVGGAGQRDDGESRFSLKTFFCKKVY